MHNLRDTIFYMKTNVLQDFHICISVPLIPKNQISVAATLNCARMDIFITKKVLV